MTVYGCHLAASCLCVFVLTYPNTAPAAQPAAKQIPGKIEWEEKSDYSHIRVRRRGDVWLLCFVRDNGEEALQTELNLKKPQEALLPYSHAMYASYLLRPEQKRVLIVGLGGGAMVHFLKHHDPELKIDVVEIDPAVVRVAEKYFHVRSEGNVQVITADGLKFLKETKERYDVIYMDAYLKPAADTDVTGLPLKLKTLGFYQGLQDKLAKGGLVAFNLNAHNQRPEDIRNIKAAFAQAYHFRPAKTSNDVVLASTVGGREKLESLRSLAKELDKRFKANFSFVNVLKTLAP
jgi:spermidine synthase